ncbi:hypothetical protein CPB85DRAFT_845185 [Mucidula mucida]|nr:hypothetical protein CPB85DRAFT_845185 [Mucidula mucida]
MESTVSLKDITISSTIMDFTFIQPPEFTKGFPVVNRDGLEFTLGLERGDLKNYYGTPMNSTKLRSDMIQLFKKKKWTLLPSQEDLECLLAICTHNRASSTLLEDRILFTLNLPPREYTYQLLPPRATPADPECGIFHVGDKQYQYPYENLPTIKTSIHPAFVLPSIDLYRLFTYSPNPTKPPVVSSVLHNLLHEIMSLVQLAIPIDWLDGTWDEYDHRGLVLVRDYPRNPREKASPPLEDGYVTPEERDVKRDNPRKRSTKLAKGAALDLKTQQSDNGTNAGSAKRALTPEPAEEPKKRRSKKPIAEPKPGLRRSTRARKNTPKYT